MQLGYVVVNEPPQEREKIADFIFRPGPIFGAERVDGKEFDAELDGRSYRSTQGFNALAMAGAARQQAPAGPAAVTVHNDRDMAWKPAFRPSLQQDRPR
jgi:hypothetical protein